MKKLCLLLCLALLLPVLTGCLLEPVENLYDVPQMPADIQALQEVVRTAMPDGAVYSPPSAGENQQAVQLVDLDGDLVDEAVVFFRTTQTDTPLSLCIFDKIDGQYQFVARLDGAGTAFDRVQYAQLDGLDGSEIVVGRRLSDQLMQLVNVYALRDGALVELASGSYSELVTTDLDADGLQDMILLRDNGATQNATAEFYHWSSGQLVRERETALSVPAANIKRILTGKLSRNIPALFVASTYAETSIITDIFIYRDRTFRNLTQSSGTDTSVQTVREYYVYSEDIDSDGLIELPRLIPMQSLENEETSKDQSVICWYNLTVNGREEVKQYTYHNYSGGWYLTLPEGWQEHLSVKRDGLVGNAMGFRFVWSADFGTQEMFSVAAVSSENAAQVAVAEGWTVLEQKGEIVYVCRLESGAAAQAVSLDTVRTMFRLIRTSWRTGETH